MSSIISCENVVDKALDQACLACCSRASNNHLGIDPLGKRHGEASTQFSREFKSDILMYVLDVSPVVDKIQRMSHQPRSFETCPSLDGKCVRGLEFVANLPHFSSAKQRLPRKSSGWLVSSACHGDALLNPSLVAQVWPTQRGQTAASFASTRRLKASPENLPAVTPGKERCLLSLTMPKAFSLLCNQ